MSFCIINNQLVPQLSSSEKEHEAIHKCHITNFDLYEKKKNENQEPKFCRKSAIG